MSIYFVSFTSLYNDFYLHWFRSVLSLNWGWGGGLFDGFLFGRIDIASWWWTRLLPSKTAHSHVVRTHQGSVCHPVLSQKRTPDSLCWDGRQSKIVGRLQQKDSAYARIWVTAVRCALSTFSKDGSQFLSASYDRFIKVLFFLVEFECEIGVFFLFSPFSILFMCSIRTLFPFLCLNRLIL